MPLPLRSAILWAILSATLSTTPAIAQSTASLASANAEEILAQLKSQATAEHKSILLSFGASWCGNCRLFDKFLADPAIHPILGRAFVFADLDAGERPGDKHHANTPGAEKLQALLGGKEAGYPYIVLLDANGEPITNSLRPVEHGGSENIGYPDALVEIDWFMEMLKKAAPALSAQDTASIHTWLLAHRSPQH
jgi:thiol-disulfide isomerase/thioredoxin